MSARIAQRSMVGRYVEQRRDALARADAIRLRRPVERERTKALPLPEARRRLAQLIVECPDWLRSAEVRKVIVWLPGVADSTGNTLINRAEVSPVKRIGELTPGQRLRLAAVLGYYPEKDGGEGGTGGG